MWVDQYTYINLYRAKQNWAEYLHLHLQEQVLN